MCRGSIAHKKFKAPTARRWCWVGSQVHTCSNAHALDFDARTLRNCSRSLNQPISSRSGEQLPVGAQPLPTTKTCCPMSVRLQIGESAHLARPYNLHSCIIECTHFVSLAIVPCWFGESRRGWGILSRQEEPGWALNSLLASCYPNRCI